MAENNLKRNKEGYGYKYTDLAQIHEYLEANKMKYIQYIERIEGDDYIMTKRFIEGKWEEEAMRGCRVVQATLQGKSNPAQEQGSALTYARRYSLLMAFGLATEDDDGAMLTKPTQQKPMQQKTFNNVISEERQQAFMQWLHDNKVDDQYIMDILQKYGYDFVSEIKEKDLKPITDTIKKMLEGEK